MSQIVLTTKDLKKTIGGRTIVSDINLELNEGEIFGFLGPNGAGKSTTIKMIVGLSSITKGDIFVAGHSVRNEFKSAMENIGCIVENPDLYNYMSGYDNLRMFAKAYEGVDEFRIRNTVQTVGLTDAIHRKVKTYSLGMKQRLGIAKAILHNPRLLILDEPTNGLDPAGIKDLREMLRKLSRETGLTVFVSSHILAEMQQMCDRVAIINKGRIVTVKTVEELVGMTENSSVVSLLIKTDNDQKARELIASLTNNINIDADGLHADIKRENVPKIVNTLSSGGISVYGMDNVKSHSLEDIFMKLTSDEGAGLKEEK